MKIEGRLKQFNFKDTMNMLMINKTNLLGFYFEAKIGTLKNFN